MSFLDRGNRLARKIAYEADLHQQQTKRAAYAKAAVERDRAADDVAAYAKDLVTAASEKEAVALWRKLRDARAAHAEAQSRASALRSEASPNPTPEEFFKPI